MIDLTRVNALLDQIINTELVDVKIRLAQLRDCALTEAEHIAVLDVYEEFGR